MYKARTHDNREVAVKVQRPDALRTVAIDYTCFAVVWKLIERWWSFQRKLKGEGPFDNGDIGDVVDTVADGLFDELDYDLEALNADRFRESLDFLGFVDVPRSYPFSMNRVLTRMDRGAHLDALSVKDGALMTQSGWKLARRLVLPVTCTRTRTKEISCCARTARWCSSIWTHVRRRRLHHGVLRAGHPRVWPRLRVSRGRSKMLGF